MRHVLPHLPNLLSGTRLVLVPVLWVLALQGETVAVGAGLVLAGATDILDGRLARRLGVASARGAALDSLADNLLVPSGVAWLVLLRSDVAVHFAAPLAVWLVLYAAFLGLGLVKFRRFGNLHLYSAKAAAIVAYVFITVCFLVPGIPVALGWVALGMSTVGVVEGLACQLICDEVDENAGSVLKVLAGRRRVEEEGSPIETDRAGRVA